MNRGHRRNRLRHYVHRMDHLQDTYWATYEQWRNGDATKDDVEQAHHNWAREWLHGL